MDLTDAVRLAEVVVGLTPPAIDCEPLLDANDDGRVDISDAVTIVEYAVRGGPALPDPFGACGEDETFDQLVCLETNCP